MFFFFGYKGKKQTKKRAEKEKPGPRKENSRHVDP